MLIVNRLMCLLSFLFLFNTYNISTLTPFQALATEVVEDNNIEIVHKDNLKLIENPIELQDEKFKQKEIEMQNEEKKNEPELKEFILTFYTSLESENSSAGAVTCQNKPLSPGGVANNVIPQNTKINLESYGQVIVNDKGSDKYFGVDNRLDVYIEREPGESDREYSRRVNSYGVQKVQGYIVKI
ncbi:MAG: 3D domain-containing protein [Clostridium sp.]|uniref:3D domain-containing protein n=1 Tax=Clostridium sp. TaxID=1506 RepID=UPI0025C02619|nr:3D domain-containing protein [Clostridium sp.]MCE5221498.1 3D domain-containing protein [Clostridium sp.]